MYPQPCGCVRMEIWHNKPRDEVGKQERVWSVKIEAMLD
jgi:hypothetical protein